MVGISEILIPGPQHRRQVRCARRDGGIVPSGQPITAERWQELVRGWFRQLVTTELRHPQFGEIALHNQLIQEQWRPTRLPRSGSGCTMARETSVSGSTTRDRSPTP
jgi:hypothetical protein